MQKIYKIWKWKYNQIISQQENILKVLRLFNKYDIEFDIYFDDIKILNDLEIQVYEKMKKSYKLAIYGYTKTKSVRKCFNE